MADSFVSLATVRSYIDALEASGVPRRVALNRAAQRYQINKALTKGLVRNGKQKAE